MGVDLILQKAAFQSSHIFMHAVHIILSTVQFLQVCKHCIQMTNKKKTLYLCTHIALTFVTDFIF